MKKSAWWALALAVAALGCTTGPTTDTPGLVVRVVGPDDQPMTGDEVYWKAPPHMEGEVAVASPLVLGTCVNAACTRWTWTELPVGDFEVRAYASTPYPNQAHCFYLHSGTRPATRAPAEMLVVTVRLDRRDAFCGD